MAQHTINDDRRLAFIRKGVSPHLVELALPYLDRLDRTPEQQALVSELWLALQRADELSNLTPLDS